MKQFSHLDAEGSARMVDIGGKRAELRVAQAEGKVCCNAATLDALRAKALPKGDVLTVAMIAGIQAAKRCDEWIPLCHSLPLDVVKVDFEVREDYILIQAMAATTAKTGVEMEALTAVSAAALTIYDMCKAVDSTMRIEGIRVIKKAKG